MRSLLHPIRCSLLLTAAVISIAIPANAKLFGYHRTAPPGSAPKAVVLDFSVAPRSDGDRDCCTRLIGYTEKEVKTEKDSRGWWLGRQDIYFNANVGRMAADLLSERLRDDCLYQITSREDLKYYYADKKDLLRDKFSMSNEKLKKAMFQLDPVAIGRELGVDKVIVGHICDSELRKAVAPGSFASVASFTVAIFDVATGAIEFEQCYTKFRNHSTQYFHYEKIAEEIAEDVRRLRGGTLVPAWSPRE